jgi:hypothetical protein
MKFNWFRRKNEELDAEIRSHLDEAIRDRIARGRTSNPSSNGTKRNRWPRVSRLHSVSTKRRNFTARRSPSAHPAAQPRNATPNFLQLQIFLLPETLLLSFRF